MILSVSRRTDIPAFYSDWFFRRLREGFVLVRNPMNYRQVSRVALDRSLIDCLVFWTKDPRKMIPRLEMLSEYNYYFLITITGYGEKIERFVPSKDTIIEAFRELSEKIGKVKTIWRYDPIILTEGMDCEYHLKNFNFLASQLEGYTELCIISFLDLYKKTKRNLKHLNCTIPDNRQKLELAKKLAEIADKHNMRIEACSEETDLTIAGIEQASCIDDGLISKISGEKIYIPKDNNQRELCNCAASIDIGAYNTCRHGCLYCYANYSDKAVNKNILAHDHNSPMLFGSIEKKDIITDRKIRSYYSSPSNCIL